MADDAGYVQCQGTVVHVTEVVDANKRVYVSLSNGPWGVQFPAHQSVQIGDGDTVSLLAVPDANVAVAKYDGTPYVVVTVAAATGVKIRKRAA